MHKAGQYRFTFVAPLINFASGVDEVRLSPSLRIIKLDDKQIATLSDLLQKWQNIRYGPYALESTIYTTEPAQEPDSYLEEGRKEIERALTVLRLFKREVAGYNVIIHPLGDSWQAYHASTWRHYELWVGPEEEYGALPYELALDAVPRLVELFRTLPSKSFDELEVSIHYFNKSYMEPYTPRDSLVDLVVSLEGMYLKGISDELGFQLRLKAAVALTRISDHEKRNTISKEIQKAYSIPGKIEHGEKHSKVEFELMLRIRDYARDSLILFLSRPTLRDDLNQCVLRGEA